MGGSADTESQKWQEMTEFEAIPLADGNTQVLCIKRPEDVIVPVEGEEDEENIIDSCQYWMDGLYITRTDEEGA